MSLELGTQNGRAATEELPLSAVQERLWVLERLHPGNSAQNVAVGVRLKGSLDAERLREAWSNIFQRHEILRNQFRADKGTPTAVVVATLPAPFRFSHAPRDGDGARLDEIIGEEARQPFDLSSAPLVRALVVRVDQDDHVFALVGHRIVCDRASLEILLEETAEWYTGSQLLAATPDYSTFVSGRHESRQKSFPWWKERLEGAPSSLDLPTDRPRPAEQTFRGATEKFSIEKSCLDQLREIAKNHDSNLLDVLIAAFYVLLWRYSRQEDVVVGMPVSGRDGETVKMVGPFQNMVALRVDVSGEPVFAELLGRVNAVVGEALGHQETTLEFLLNHLLLERDMSRAPLFQATFAVREQGRQPWFGDGITAKEFEAETGAETFDLCLEFVEREGRLEGSVSYNRDLFDAATIQRMTGHFRILLEASAADPGAPIARLPLLTEAERRQLLVEWNQAPVEHKPEKCIHELVEAQVARTPNAVAVVCDGRSLTYGELNLRANRLAHYLRKRGIGPETLVAICMERSLDMIVGIVGVLKAGGAYLPLDLSYPPERLAFMIEDANPPVVVTQQGLEAKLPQHKAEIICVDRDWPAIAQESGANPASGTGPQSLAYIIYTSGSTGKPKGCQITHFNVVRLFQATWDWYKFDESDVWTMFHSYAFDFSVWEIWGALFYGGRVVIVPYLVSRSPEAFYRLLCDERVTVLNQTPSAFRQLILAEESVGAHELALRYVIFGGEALEMRSLKPWYQRHGDQKPVLVNMYGITETTVHVTYRPLSAADTDRGSVIGRPIPDLQLYVLDQHRQPVPIGVTGEMYVGGSGVARGYLSRPELTAERFIPDPFRAAPGARLYKTGDLARFLTAGDIEYLGRIDHQVKIRGFRIELGEIESVLARHPAIHQNLVMAREDTPGDKRLVAYVVPKRNEHPSVADLRSYIRQSLPEYMVPSTFSLLEALPLTPTGKIDRRALPAPVQEHRDQSAILAPRNEREELLLSIFREILNVESVSISDDFFDLGGHSLMAARLVSQIHAATGRKIQLADLFRAATVESLARLIQRESDATQDPVVMEIKRGDSNRLPFFAIVPPGEEALGYAMLARHMGPEQSVFKIQGKEPVTGGKRPYSADEMKSLTAEYIAAIRSVQPNGPYCVGGFCDGTHIAEQIVLSLEEQGGVVGLFAIFDTWVLQHSQVRWLWKIHYYSQRLREMKRLSLKERLASYKRLAQNKAGQLTGSRPARTDWQQTYWPESFAPRKFQAPVLLFKRPKQPFYYLDDPLMGWGVRSKGGVEVHEVDFHHAEILREPQVRFFGEELTMGIARVRTESARPVENQAGPALTAAE